MGCVLPGQDGWPARSAGKRCCHLARRRSTPASVKLSLARGRMLQMLRLTRVMLFVIGLLALVPTLAHAQASITGVVRDPSGAVLPGVTVEASSPVLIEKRSEERRVGKE